MNSGKKQNQTGTGFTEKIMGNPVSKAQLVMAFFVAGIADLILTPLDPTPLCMVIDLMVALALFVVLGWRIILLPALIAEAIPVMAIFPFWVMVVGSIAVFGTIRKPGSSDKTPDVLTTSTGESSVPPVYTDKVPPRDFSKDAGKGTIIDVPVEDTEKDK